MVPFTRICEFFSFTVGCLALDRYVAAAAYSTGRGRSLKPINRPELTVVTARCFAELNLFSPLSFNEET